MKNFIQSLPRTSDEMILWLFSAFVEMTLNPSSLVRMEEGEIRMKGSLLSIVTGEKYPSDEWFPVAMGLEKDSLKLLVTTKEVL